MEITSYLCIYNAELYFMDIDPVTILESCGIKPTVNRILVVKELAKSSRPVNLAYLEAELCTMDKASIFRVLELLAEKDVVHVIEDGSRSLKYELCQGGANHSLSDHHVHFYCDSCRETFCFESVKIPAIDIPEGFRPRAVNYVLKGLCPKCGAK